MTAEISCLRAEIERGDQQIKELEEQVSGHQCHLINALSLLQIDLLSNLTGVDNVKRR